MISASKSYFYLVCPFIFLPVTLEFRDPVKFVFSTLLEQVLNIYLLKEFMHGSKPDLVLSLSTGSDDDVRITELLYL